MRDTTRLMGWACLLAWVVLAASGTAGGAVWIVDDDGGEGVDFTDIQEAINYASNGDTVLVKPGWYEQENINFLGKAITVRSEDPNQINPQEDPRHFYLMGFRSEPYRLALQNVDTSRFAYVVGAQPWDNINPNFVFENGEDRDSVLEGFIIAYGDGRQVPIGDPYAYSRYGGGIYIENSSPTIRRNIILISRFWASRGGSARGGGIYSRGGSPLLEENMVAACLVGTAGQNESDNDGRGGGIYLEGGFAQLINNVVTDNTAASGLYGGGVYITDGMAWLEGNIIYNNGSFVKGGGIYLAEGALAYIGNNVIAHSMPEYDWGRLGSGGQGVYCAKGSGAIIKNNVISFNEMEGIYVEAGATVDITNNIISDNQGYGIVCEEGTYYRRSYDARSGQRALYVAYQNRSSQAKRRAYEPLGFTVTRGDDFLASFYVKVVQSGNYDYDAIVNTETKGDIGFVGLYDSSVANDIKPFVGLNLGAVYWAYPSAPALSLRALMGSYEYSNASPEECVVEVDKFYKVQLAYTASDSTFRLTVTDAEDPNTVVCTDSTTVTAAVSFRLDAFGISDTDADDGRAMTVVVDDVHVASGQQVYEQGFEEGGDSWSLTNKPWDQGDVADVRRFWYNAVCDNGGGAMNYKGISGGYGCISPDNPPSGNGILFADPGHWESDHWVLGDYHLRSTQGRWDPRGNDGAGQWVVDEQHSRGIDAGNPSDHEIDASGQPSRINMGAYGGTTQASLGSARETCVADFDNDGIVNWPDFEIFMAWWLETGDALPVDLDHDGRVDWSDFAIFAGYWLWEAPWHE